MILVLDIDGTLLDYRGRVITILMNFGVPKERVYDWVYNKENYGKIPEGIPLGTYWKMVFTESAMKLDKPFEGSVETVNKFKDLFDIAYLTARLKSMEKTTLSHLNKFGFPEGEPFFMEVDEYSKINETYFMEENAHSTIRITNFLRSFEENIIKHKIGTIEKLSKRYKHGICVGDSISDIKAYNTYKGFVSIGLTNTHEEKCLKDADYIVRDWFEVEKIIEECIKKMK